MSFSCQACGYLSHGAEFCADCSEPLPRVGSVVRLRPESEAFGDCYVFAASELNRIVTLVRPYVLADGSTHAETFSTANGKVRRGFTVVRR